MKKRSKSLLCVLLGAGFALSLGLSFGSFPNISAKADSQTLFTSSEASVQVNMFDKNNTKINSTKGIVKVQDQDYNYYKANWADLNYFQISIPSPMENLVDVNSYSLSVKWIPEEISASGATVDFKVDRLCSGLIASGSFNNENTATIKSPFNFFIDGLGGVTDYSANNILKDKNDTTDSYIKNGGWGIYQFIFTINTTTYSSSLFEVKPTDVLSIPEDADITIQANETRSEYLIDNAYEIFFKNADSPFNFVKRDLIKWYVSGQSSEGKPYVLLPSHKTNENESSLLTDESNDYIGTEMKFDFNIAGSWKVNCQVINPADNTVVRTSNTISFSTVKVIPASTIIWIIVGAVAGAAIILTVIIVVAKKKEKIW